MLHVTQIECSEIIDFRKSGWYHGFFVPMRLRRDFIFLCAGAQGIYNADKEKDYEGKTGTD